MLNKLKNAWKSLTIWVNGIAITIVPLLEYARDNYSLVRDSLGPDVFKYLGMTLFILNIALRFKTNKDLSDK